MNRRLNMVSPPQSLSRIGDIEGDLLLSTMHNQEREGTRKYKEQWDGAFSENWEN